MALVLIFSPILVFKMPQGGGGAVRAQRGKGNRNYNCPRGSAKLEKNS